MMPTRSQQLVNANAYIESLHPRAPRFSNANLSTRLIGRQGTRILHWVISLALIPLFDCVVE